MNIIESAGLGNCYGRTWAPRADRGPGPAAHYAQWWAYQPQSRFWHFQLIEGGWLLALSLVLLAATVWLVHRRAA